LRRSSVLGGWVKAEVGFTDSLLDHCNHFLFKRLHADGARVDQGHIGNLAQVGRATVVFHHDVVENPGVGAAGTYFRQVGAQSLKRLLHSQIGILFNVSNAHAVLLFENGCFLN
jgi:hypothetical protein